jgi:hypothetical protein
MHGVSSLPKVLGQKLQKQIDKMSGKQSILTKRKQEEDGGPPGRKRKCFNYEVGQEKLYTEEGCNKEQLFVELQDVADSDAETRAEVFAQFRHEIVHKKCEVRRHVTCYTQLFEKTSALA